MGIYQHFYEKNKKKLIEEVSSYGLEVSDEEKFESRVKKITRNSIINSIILLGLLLLIIIKWVMTK